MKLSRRTLLQSVAALTGVAWLPGCERTPDGRAVAGLGFEPIRGSTADAVIVPNGYEAQVLLRWGDSLDASVPSLDLRQLASGAALLPGAAARQARQFGYNCDAIQFFALDRGGRRGALCVNHEYTSPELIFPSRRSRGREGDDRLASWAREHREGVAFELAAHGASIVEIELDGGAWRMREGSRLTRRVTATTPIEIAGPAAGHPLLVTPGDPSGRLVRGMLGNCAGGRTPWGTYLTAEENINDYFGGFRSWRDSGLADGRTLAAHARYVMFEHGYHGWEHVEGRFDFRQAPNEPLRFGWIVEIDPRDPRAPVRKRTALGRFMHEGATSTLSRDGRCVVYCADDERFEYLYKFVSSGQVDLENPGANRDLLDKGTLYVARFEPNGIGRWRPLVHDERGPLRTTTGFADQGEVLIKARAAADLLGATPLDRPEDVAVDPRTGRVYVAFTKNHDRGGDTARRQISGREVDTRVDAVNPRPDNDFGHIVEFDESDGDAGALEFRWRILLLAGDPRALGSEHLTRAATLVPGEIGHADTYFAGAADVSALVPIACPDNLSVDGQGRLWIVTDGAQPDGNNNGCFVMPTDGPDRGQVRQFMSAPRGAEVCGCEFTPDGETLFLSIQHPGEGGSIDDPRSHWPDGDDLPPRPAVVAIRKRS